MNDVREIWIEKPAVVDVDGTKYCKWNGMEVKVGAFATKAILLIMFTVVIYFVRYVFAANHAFLCYFVIVLILRKTFLSCSCT